MYQLLHFTVVAIDVICIVSTPSEWPIFCHQSLEFKMIKTIVILIITSPKLITTTVMITTSRTSRPTLSPLSPLLLSSSSSPSSYKVHHHYYHYHHHHHRYHRHNQHHHHYHLDKFATNSYTQNIVQNSGAAGGFTERFEHFDVISMVDKSIDRGKMFSILLFTIPLTIFDVRFRWCYWKIARDKQIAPPSCHFYGLYSWRT